MTTTTAFETHITIEPIPANPGYTAHITGRLADPERDPSGWGITRTDAALDLARYLLDLGPTYMGSARDCICLAIAAVLRAEMEDKGWSPESRDTGPYFTAYKAAIATVEGIW